MKALPKTHLGKWAAGLFGIFVLSFLFMQIMVMLGQTGGNTFSDNLWLAVPGFIAGIFAITAGVVGGVSIWKHKERSLLVYAITTIALLILVFLVGELIPPH